MDRRVHEKKENLLNALDKGMAQIHLDARRPGVIVPTQHRGNHQLVLNLSYRFDPPDLTVSEWGVRETLSFGGQRFTVGVPWSAVYAVASLVTHEVWMYPDDMPKELIEGAVAKHASDAPPVPSDEEDASPRAILREVVGERAPDSDAEEKQEPTPPRRGHLRVVK